MTGTRSRPSPAQLFWKLEALGNDFVLIDRRQDPGGQTAAAWELNAEHITGLADRRTGIGFDQMLVLQTGASGTVAAVAIFNADGSPAEQCGNGMRAIAAWLDHTEPLTETARLETPAGNVTLFPPHNHLFSTELPGPAMVDADVSRNPLPVPDRAIGWNLVSTGNPHLVLVWPAEPSAADLETVADAFDSDSEWSNQVNIGLLHVGPHGRCRLRVHERGAGPTPACGSGACAAAAVAIARGLAESPVTVEQPGGALVIDWQRGSDRIRATGPAQVIFEGRLSKDKFLEKQ